MGGDITVSSEVGKGSRFTLHIPLHRQGKLEESIVMDICSYSVHGRVLIVEDSPTNATLINEMIQQFNITHDFNIETMIRTDGLEAVECVKHESFDLILMDVNMDRLNGCQACRIIRQSNNKQNIVALTGNIYARQHEDHKQFRQFNETVIKPCTEGKLLNILLRYLPQTVIEIDGSTTKCQYSSKEYPYQELG